ADGGARRHDRAERRRHGPLGRHRHRGRGRAGSVSGTIEAERILEQVEHGAFGDDPREPLSRAIRIADEAGADELAYRARMLMTDVAHWHNDADAMLAAFAWCVARHDSDPARFPITAGG